MCCCTANFFSVMKGQRHRFVAWKLPLGMTMMWKLHRHFNLTQTTWTNKIHTKETRKGESNLVTRVAWHEDPLTHTDSCVYPPPPHPSPLSSRFESGVPGKYSKSGDQAASQPEKAATHGSFESQRHAVGLSSTFCRPLQPCLQEMMFTCNKFATAKAFWGRHKGRRII